MYNHKPELRIKPPVSQSKTDGRFYFFSPQGIVEIETIKSQQKQ